MESIFNITTTSFLNTLRRLGISKIPVFRLVNTVQPVALVDASVQISTNIPVCDIPYTAGVLDGPVGTTVLADTTAQVAGSYDIKIIGSNDAPSAMRCYLKRRNFNNTADVWSQFMVFTANTNTVVDMRIVLGESERLRIEMASAGSAGNKYQASIWLEPAVPLIAS